MPLREGSTSCSAIVLISLQVNKRSSSAYQLELDIIERLPILLPAAASTNLLQKFPLVTIKFVLPTRSNLCQCHSQAHRTTEEKILSQVIRKDLKFQLKFKSDQ